MTASPVRCAVFPLSSSHKGAAARLADLLVTSQHCTSCCTHMRLLAEVEQTMCGGQHVTIDLRCLSHLSWDLTSVDVTTGRPAGRPVVRSIDVRSQVVCERQRRSKVTCCPPHVVCSTSENNM